MGKTGYTRRRSTVLARLLTTSHRRTREDLDWARSHFVWLDHVSVGSPHPPIPVSVVGATLRSPGKTGVSTECLPGTGEQGCQAISACASQI